MSEKALRHGLVAAVAHLQAELANRGISAATVIELPAAEDGEALKADLAKATELVPVYSMGGRRTLPPNEMKVGGVTFRWPGAGGPMPADLLEAIDQFIAEEHPQMSRADAMGLALRDWAIGHGYLPNPPANEEAN